MKHSQDIEARLARIDERAAGPMFGVSLLFLMLLAGTLHWNSRDVSESVLRWCTYGLLLLYPVFIAEFVVHWRLKTPVWKHRALCCLVPPFRIGARDAITGRRLWLPSRGWKDVDDALRVGLEKAFSVPMMIIALLILPLIAAEHFWQSQIAASPTLSLLTHAGEGVIWAAFTVEFIIMISVVEKRLEYCKKHWIDIAVICLPLIAFLRALRISRLLRLNTLTKTARIYRMRGTLMRMYRAFLVLELLERVLRIDPEKKLRKLQEVLLEKEREVEQLRSQICRLEERIAEPAAEDSQVAQAQVEEVA